MVYIAGAHPGEQSNQGPGAECVAACSAGHTHRLPHDRTLLPSTATVCVSVAAVVCLF